MTHVTHVTGIIPAVIRRRPFTTNETKQTQQARILNPDWQYTPASRTDVLETWRKHGFVPPTEQKLRAKWEKEQAMRHEA